MRFFIYSRKSVWSARGDSVENQVEMCRRYIAEKFGEGEHQIAVYEDEGFSAKDTDRPQFQFMLRDLYEQRPDYLICYRLDRISRSVSDFSALVEELARQGTALVCMREEFDTAKPMGKAMMYIASVFAQLERETIAERVRDNMLLLARSGRWLGGTTPTGYRSVQVRELVLEGRVKTACKLQPVEEELQWVRQLYAVYIQEHSLSAAHRALEMLGAHNRRGIPFTRMGVKAMLQNPVYCAADAEAHSYFTARGAAVCFDPQKAPDRGLLVYNKRGTGGRRQEVEQWVVAAGRHPGLICGGQWVRVQKILREEQPTIDRPGKQHNDYAMLSGLMFCTRCGQKLLAKKRSGPQREGQYDYICSSKLTAGTRHCDSQNLAGPATDQAVWQHLCGYLCARPEQLQTALRQLRREYIRQLPQSPAQLQREIQRAQTEIQNLVAALSAGNAPAIAGHIARQIEQLDRQVLCWQRQLEGQGQRTETAPVKREAARLLRRRRWLEDLDRRQRRQLMRAVVQRMDWDGEKLYIYYRGETGQENGGGGS
ncbi:recombinase family protein [Neobittarella massiliensis]|uniref:Recombinase family protein n=1 Tax=Neobittarella massiliensis (ex Bilen et al. 2018) TaxID=2041842 RepID=A0A8J6IQV6_9FIRM|nr:recombinase family protein [Neobittarella massiliensis]MBC3517390.1 recombinase family protein [Neobittarella massiliensis]